MMQRVSHRVVGKAHREFVLPQMNVGGTERRVRPHHRDEGTHEQQQAGCGFVRDKVVQGLQEAVDFFKAPVVPHDFSSPKVEM
jgi:hypothetical protein